MALKAEQNWYFSAPWEPVLVRRGDALGFRASADYFADKIAPGLSNSTYDARWITLLSWCLKWSHVAWEKAGGGDLTSREGQRERYEWLRPLELLWVARTLESGQTSGQLRGRRSIEKWRKKRSLPNFAMSDDQFRRYRQTGIYGAYRVVFRTIPGLTTGDGWTPTKTAHELAKIVNVKLPPKSQIKDGNFEEVKSVGSKDTHDQFWIERGWKEWHASPKTGLLPTPNNALSKPLPLDERNLLKPILFSNDSVRTAAVKALVNTKEEDTHADLCDVLAGANELLAALPAFTRFADAAMNTMRMLWDEINSGKESQGRSITALVKSKELNACLTSASTAGKKWLEASQKSSDFTNKHIVDELAKALCNARNTRGQLLALVEHHEQYGGGRRWFCQQGDNLIPQVKDTAIAAGNYRFRLQSLCLLAAQCGIRIPGLKNALAALKRDAQAVPKPQRDNEDEEDGE